MPINVGWNITKWRPKGFPSGNIQEPIPAPNMALVASILPFCLAILYNSVAFRISSSYLWVALRVSLAVPLDTSYKKSIFSRLTTMYSWKKGHVEIIWHIFIYILMLAKWPQYHNKKISWNWIRIVLRNLQNMLAYSD